MTPHGILTLLWTLTTYVQLGVGAEQSHTDTYRRCRNASRSASGHHGNTDAVWEVVQSMVEDNDLSHLLYFSHKGHTTDTPFLLVDLPCSYLHTGLSHWAHLVPARTQVLNIAIRCPHQYLLEVPSLDVAPLLSPMTNLVLIHDYYDVDNHLIGDVDSITTDNDDCLDLETLEQITNKWGMIAGVIHVFPIQDHLKAKGFMMSSPPGSKTKYEGYIMELIKVFAEELNFTYSLSVSTDSKYGSEYANGSWSGLVGKIVNREVDLVVADISVVASRMVVVDFTTRHWETRLAVTVRTNGLPDTLIYSPFSWQVWVLIAVCAAMTGVIVYIQEHLLSSKPRRKRCLIERLWLAFGVCVNQGSHDLPVFVSSRVAVAFLLFGILALIAPFSGSLVASFTTRKPTLPFNTLDELAADRKYTLMTIEGNTAHNVLRTARRGTLRKLWEKMLTNLNTSLQPSVPAAASLLFGSGSQEWAYIGTRTSSKSRWEKLGRCDWAFIPETFYPSGFAAALPRGSPYTDVFSNVISRAAETGLLSHWKKQYFKAGPCAEGGNRSAGGPSPMSPREAVGTFLLLSVGLSFSTFILIAEIVTSRCHTKRTRDLTRSRYVDENIKYMERWGCIFGP